MRIVSPADSLMPLIFADLERLRDQATLAGDAELAVALDKALAHSVEAYCEAKREHLAQAIADA